MRVLPGKGRGSRNKGRKSPVCEPKATWEPVLPQASAQGQDPGDHKSEHSFWGAGMGDCKLEWTRRERSLDS